MFVVLAFLFIFFAWTRVLARFHDGSISVYSLLFWSAIWLSAGIVVGWPNLTGTIAQKLGIGRGVDVIVYLSIILLFYLMFRMYIKISHVDREITRLVRALALKDKKQK